ncbi:recombinase family protein [Polyangium fumosum]|uniref:Recombinase family protein n=1 Tax=Polyangium fumosum TaxID=889272 RepID=A0A4V5PN67_9BACT|nr:recombinase family protein [Polyangium fumosum]TKD03460.1 recombinase family protein [Polyangium fumosum]
MRLYQLRTALYARRSTDGHQMASLDVQREEGARFVEAEGGTHAPDHLFVDDAVSRAEFKKRPGLFALLNAAKAGEFDAVVVRDESRLGGDTFRSGLVIQDILESGVRLFYYYTGEEVTLDGAVGCLNCGWSPRSSGWLSRPGTRSRRTPWERRPGDHGRVTCSPGSGGARSAAARCGLTMAK